MRFIMIVAMPCTAGMLVLADPIIQLLFPGTSPLGGHLIQAGAVSILFYSISTLSNAVLQGIDRMRIPIRNAVIALIINVISVPISIYVFRLNIYSVIVGNVVFSLVMCILNGRSVQKYSGFRPDIMKTFVKPGIASVLMGVIVFAVYFVCNKVTGHSSISTILAIAVGIAAYFILLLLIKGITEEELKSFPKGGLLIRIGRKLHLL